MPIREWLGIHHHGAHVGRHRHRIEQPPGGEPSAEQQVQQFTQQQDSQDPQQAQQQQQAQAEYERLNEEHDLEVALALSQSDSDARRVHWSEEHELDAAKRQSLVLASSMGQTEALSYKLWDSDSLDYQDVVTDGFYDLHGDFSPELERDVFPSLAALRALKLNPGDKREQHYLSPGSCSRFVDRKQDCALTRAPVLHSTSRDG
eukprot:jgi/Astpho2/9731/Aster-x0410